MLALKIDTDTQRRLAEAARKSGEQPATLAARALEAYLEDLEDYAFAVEASKEFDPARTVSLEEMRRELGMDA